MINLLFIFAGIIAFVYYYSIGVYFVMKKLGVEKPWMAFSPFYAFQMVNKEAKTFTVFTIPTRKYMLTVIILVVVCLLASLYGLWGNENLPIQSVGPLWEIMALVMSFCVLIFYASLYSSSKKLFLRFKVERAGILLLLIALILPIPFVYIYLSKKELRILQ